MLLCSEIAKSSGSIRRVAVLLLCRLHHAGDRVAVERVLLRREIAKSARRARRIAELLLRRICFLAECVALQGSLLVDEVAERVRRVRRIAILLLRESCLLAERVILRGILLRKDILKYARDVGCVAELLLCEACLLTERVILLSERVRREVGRVGIVREPLLRRVRLLIDGIALQSLLLIEDVAKLPRRVERIAHLLLCCIGLLAREVRHLIDIVLVLARHTARRVLLDIVERR